MMKIHQFNNESLLNIMDLGNLIHSPDDLNKVLHFLVKKVANLMSADACTLFLYDNQSELLTLKATSGLNDELVDKLSIKSGHGLTGKTIKLLKPISIADAKKSSNYVHVSDLGEENYSSYLSVPLVYNGDPIGVMAVQNKKTTRFKKKDIDFLLTLSIPAVSLVEKAKFMGAVGSVVTSSTQNQKKQTKDDDVTIHYLKDHFLKGIPAVPGISMGRLKIIKNNLTNKLENVEELNTHQEEQKLKDAFVAVSLEIQESKKKTEAKFGPDEATIFEAYLLFLESANFKQQIIHEIHNGLSALASLDKIVGKYMDRMAMAQDEYLKERAYDIQDVARKISDHLIYGQTSLHDQFECHEDTIICHDYWSVSDFVNLDLKHTKGIISANGGASSHISILADTLNLPAILGMGSACTQLNDDDYIIIDGFSGNVIVNPSKNTIHIYKKELQKIEERKKLFQSKKDQRVMVGSSVKHHLPIGANLGMVAHINTAIGSGADMVGLYRTEFPFLVRKTLPTEEDQYLIYKRAIELMKGKEVVFRTLDIGGDKYVPYLNLPDESNPALGWRAIRFSLERKDLFRIQLRALLRASAHGKISILLPMVTGVEQIYQTREIFDSVRKELRDEKVAMAKNIPVGAMIEVPSAVEIADKIAKEVDFFSLGTNDLVQYCLAVDRTNPLVADLYDPYHPAILKMIQRAVKAAHKSGLKISICGDMAAQPLLAAVLIGLGIDSLSMIPRSVPKIKYLARKLDYASIEKIASRCLKMDTGLKIRKELEAYFLEHKLTDFTLKGRAPLTES